MDESFDRAHPWTHPPPAATTMNAQVTPAIMRGVGAHTAMLREMFEHNHAMWDAFADKFVEMGSDAITHNHESSHNTIANVAMHAVNMEDWWLHYVWEGKEWDGPAWDGFSDPEKMRARIHEVRDKTRALLAKADWSEVRDLGEAGKMSLEQVIAEVYVEAAHHRGEVIAMMWATETEPPYVPFSSWLADRG